jgi:hypothetical protein
MRTFEDAAGAAWTAQVHETPGPDYKGRYYLVLTAEDGSRAVRLEDVRWNSERTARRTLETMSVAELRRRLRAAVGRGTLSATV